MTINVYKSTDTSAPVMSGQIGALVGLLDACLVNGYGSQSAAGWAIEYTATNQRAYRAASGNRLRLLVDDTASTSANVSRIVGAEVATAAFAGTALFPTAAQLSGGYYFP